MSHGDTIRSKLQKRYVMNNFTQKNTLPYAFVSMVSKDASKIDNFLDFFDSSEEEIEV